MASKIIDKAMDKLGKGSSGGVKLAGERVHHTGYGLMGLTWRKTPPSQEQSFEAMKTALECGANFWNGGELYGNPERNSLHLLNEYFTKYPKDASKVILSIKGGLKPGELTPDGSPENTRRSIDECLKVLDGKKKLDIWEAARVDPNTPIEITMRTAWEYVKSGQLGAISLSECSEDTIRRAAKEVTISAVEVEFSLWETAILENGVAQACVDLDIPIVAYSPLGRGFLTGQIKKPEDIPDGDLRKTIPRFQPEHFYKNIEMVHQIEELAKRKGATPGQIALAWVRAQSRKPGMPTFIPIPGATTAERIQENMGEVDLSDNDVKEVDSILASVEIVGNRASEQGAKLHFGTTPPLQE